MIYRRQFLTVAVILTAFITPVAQCASAPSTIHPSESRPQAEPPATEPDLSELLTDYFKAPSERDRARIASQIAATDGMSVHKVAESLGSLQLWEAQEIAVQHFALHREQTGRADQPPSTVHVRLPRGYDPADAYPLLLALPDNGGSAETMLQFTSAILDERVNGYILAAVTDYRGAWLNSSWDASRDLPALIDELTHRHHVDTDRVYVTGYGMGGHAAFSLAVLYADYFAAAVPLAATLALESRIETTDLFLPNARHVSLLVVYGELDRPEGGNNHKRPGGVAGWNRYLKGKAQSMALPLDMLEVPGVGRTGVIPPTDAFGDILRRTRPHVVRRVDHWFRYPPQGRAAWLRARRLLTEPWTAQHVVVAPAPGESEAQAVTQVLKEKLAYFGGEIDGQSIRIQTHNCARLDLLLSDELIDLDEDIAIYVDGTKRFGGRPLRRVDTLLDLAHEDWDFQRLWPVRFQINRTGRAVQY